MIRLLLLWLLLLPVTTLAGGLQDQISKTYIDPNITGYPTASLPANATRGQLAFDTTTNQLKVYNGSAWVASSGGGASTSDHFVTTTSDGDVANATNLGALSTGYIKCTVAGGICTVSSDATVATAASTTSFTNKTLDCNGTGNSCLNFPGGAIGGAIGSSTHNKILYTDNTGLLQELTLADGQVPTASSGSIVAGTIDISSTTVTFTNKTYDAEGTGNVLSLPIKKWLPAAGCNNATAGTVWDLPTSTPAVPTCVTGTNIQKGVLAYADTSGGFSAQITEVLPSDWTTTGGVDAKILWTTTATSGNAKWSLSTACTDVAATATDDPTFNAANTVTTQAPGVASKVVTSAITGLTMTGCTTATNMLLHLKLFRDGNDAADTISATANVIGVLLTYRRAI